MARMISSESKTIIGDREAFAELHPKLHWVQSTYNTCWRNNDALAPSVNMTARLR